jgi:lipopolysaccharide export system protein LptC
MQHTAAQPVVQMRDLVGNILLDQGPARLTAASGNYNYDTQLVTVPDVVNFIAADGYHMRTSGVAIDLDNKTMVGSGGVKGADPAGTFSADSIHADLNKRIVSLQGNARLRMVPGKVGTLQVPH